MFIVFLSTGRKIFIFSTAHNPQNVHRTSKFLIIKTQSISVFRQPRTSYGRSFLVRIIGGLSEYIHRMYSFYQKSTSKWRRLLDILALTKIIRIPIDRLWDFRSWLKTDEPSFDGRTFYGLSSNIFCSKTFFQTRNHLLKI